MNLMPDELDEQDEYIGMSPDQEKIRNAYVKERRQREVIEIELNRSKIMMIDEKGRRKRVPIIAEH